MLRVSHPTYECRTCGERVQSRNTCKTIRDSIGQRKHTHLTRGQKGRNVLAGHDGAIRSRRLDNKTEGRTP